MQVAVSTAPRSIPAAPMTAGWTNRMYAIVRNVVTPARTSVRTVVRSSDRRNSRSSMAAGRILDGQGFVSQSIRSDSMTEFSRALEQIAEIHEHLAKTEVYRGWRSLPVASSALVGLAAAAWQSAMG